MVAQDLIDFFLGYFPDLKDAAVAQREGETIIFLVFLKCVYMWSSNRTLCVTCCILCKNTLVSTVTCYITSCGLGLEFERWLSGCGPPMYEPDLSAGAALTQPVEKLCELWRHRDAPDLSAVSRFDLSAWSTFQIVMFLDHMLDLSPLSHGTVPHWYRSFNCCYSDSCTRLSFTSLSACLSIRRDVSFLSMLLISV